jgi:hypothetical protein
MSRTSASRVKASCAGPDPLQQLDSSWSGHSAMQISPSARWAVRSGRHRTSDAAARRAHRW